MKYEDSDYLESGEPALQSTDLLYCDLILPDDEGFQKIQVRDRGLDETLVVEYADAMERGDLFPRPVVYRHSPKLPRYYIADGLHRVAAWALVQERNRKTPAGRKRWSTMTFETHERGGYTGAVRHACQANGRNGKRRTREDLLLTIDLALEAGIIEVRMTDRDVGLAVGASQQYINRLKNAFLKGSIRTTSSLLHCSKLFTAEREGKDGKSYPATKKGRKPRKSCAEPIVYEQLDFWARLAKQPHEVNEDTAAALEPIPVLKWLRQIFPQLEIKFEEKNWKSQNQTK